jgi:hypothetical protein
MVSMQVCHTLLEFMVYQTIELDYIILFYPKTYSFWLEAQVLNDM